MSIKPIDIQTNIGQIHEVSRTELAKQGALAEQQNILDKEAADKSNLKKSRLDETEKGEKTSIRDEDKKKDSRGKNEREKKSENEAERKKELLHDERMGNLIDVFK